MDSSQAKAANRRRSSSVWGAYARKAATLNWFLVMVPVLSQHRMSIAAASSTADRRVTRTPRFANSSDPRALASVYVAGSATGTEATSRIRANGMISVRGIPPKIAYAKMTTTRSTSMATRYLTTVKIKVSRRRGAVAVRTSSAVLP